MNKEKLLMEKCISSKDFSIDPRNKNYTIPRTYGVYEIQINTRSKRFRFGNHPVREEELIREFENVKVTAVFYERSDAMKLASLLNS